MGTGEGALLRHWICVLFDEVHRLEVAVEGYHKANPMTEAHPNKDYMDRSLGTVRELSLFAKDDAIMGLWLR